MARGPKIYTTGDVARFCSVAPRTVSKWFDSGKLKGWRIPGSKDRRVKHDDLVSFMAKHAIPMDLVPAHDAKVLVVGCRDEAAFEGSGLEATFAGSSFRAGVEFATKRPACVVVDMELGRVEGRVIAREARAAGVPCVALSDSWPAEEMVDDGFSGVVGRTPDVGACIRAVVEGHADEARQAVCVGKKRRAS
jgi:CheY-like chemotaxis protein